MPVCKRHDRYYRNDETCVYCDAPDTKQKLSRKARIEKVRAWLKKSAFAGWEDRAGDYEIEFCDRSTQYQPWHFSLGRPSKDDYSIE